MMRSNIDLFEEDYVRNRKEAKNPDAAYPTEASPKEWMEMVQVWYNILEIMGGLDENFIAVKIKDSENLR